MNQLEDRLRDELWRLAEPMAAGSDAHLAVMAGNRLRRRRWIGGLAGVAAVLVVAAPLAGPLGGGRGGAAVIATPAPVPSASVEVSPGTPTASATGEPSGHGSLQIVLADREEMPDYGLRAIQFRTQEAAEGVRAVVTSVDAEGGHVESGGVATGTRPLLVKVSGQVWAMVFAEEPAWVEGARAGGGLAAADVRPVPDAGAWAVLLEAESETAELGGLLWMDADAVVRDAVGTTVPTATISLSGREFSFVRDADRTMACGGERHDDYSDLACSDLSQVSAENLIEVGGGQGSRAHSGYEHYESYSYVVLPEGSQEGIEVDTGAVTCGVAGDRIGAEGQLVYLVLCETDDEMGSPIRAIEYRDAVGERVTFRP